MTRILSFVCSSLFSFCEMLGDDGNCVLQVRSLRAPYPLIQTVVLRNARRLLQSNNAAIVALDYAVYGLFPVPLGAQVFLMLLLTAADYSLWMHNLFWFVCKTCIFSL